MKTNLKQPKVKAQIDRFVPAQITPAQQKQVKGGNDGIFGSEDLRDG